MCLKTIINRQCDIKNGIAENIKLPKFKKYAICNLRGGIGKTTLSFNLSYLSDNLLAVDTCPQGNLSYFYDNQYYASGSVNVRDMILPYLVPGIGRATHVSSFIGATNDYFSGKNNYYIPSLEELYILPSQLNTAISQASSLPNDLRNEAYYIR